MSTGTVDKLVIATVSGSRADAVTNSLVEEGFYITQLDSSGGIMYESTVTLLIGLSQVHLPRLLEHLREHCRTRRRPIPVHVDAYGLEAQPVMIEAEVGGANIYVLDVERFEQL